MPAIFSNPPDDAFGEQALRPRLQDEQGPHLGEPGFEDAAGGGPGGRLRSLRGGDGATADAGKYHLKVTSEDGATDTGYTYLEDKVTGINYAKDGLRLEVRGQSIAMDQVVHGGGAPKP